MPQPTSSARAPDPRRAIRCADGASGRAVATSTPAASAHLRGDGPGQPAHGADPTSRTSCAGSHRACRCRAMPRPWRCCASPRRRRPGEPPSSSSTPACPPAGPARIVGVQSREMDAEPEGVHLDYSQVVTRRLLEAFRDAGCEADLHPGGQPHDHPTRPASSCALGPWPAQTRLSARLCRFELLGRQLNHDIASRPRAPARPPSGLPARPEACPARPRTIGRPPNADG